MPVFIPTTGRYQDRLGRRLSPRTAAGQFRERTGEGGMLLWYGQEILDGMLERAIIAVREVTRRAAEHAAENHPWANRTGETEASVHAQEPIVEGDFVRGRWGAQSPALYLEFGTVKMPAYPFLRPAADATYPELPLEIREGGL